MRVQNTISHVLRRVRGSALPRCWALVLLLFLGIQEGAFAEAVRVGGTGSGSVLIERLAQDYRRLHPGAEVTVVMPPLSSGGGMRALAAGRLDIAIVGRAPKPEETSLPGVGKSFEYARTPLVMASSADKAKAVSLKELADVYAGRTLNWPDGRPIRLILRSKTESDIAIMRGASPELSAAIDESYNRNGMAVADNDIDTVDLIANTPGSLGPTTLGFLRLDGRQFAVLTLNGVQPSLESMASGRYTWVKSIYLAASVAPTLDAQRFLAFLWSDHAKQLLTKADFIPAFP